MKVTRWLILLIAFAAAQSWALESGTLLKDEVLREKAKASAKVLAKVDKGVKVDLLRVSGPWFFVKIDNKWQGWVPVDSIRRHDSTFGGGINDVRSGGGMPSATPGSAGSMPATSGSAFHP